MRYLVAFILVVALGLTSCSQKDTGSCGEEPCTADFAMITVWLADSTGNAYVPDSVQTYNTAGIKLHQSTTPSVPNSNYYTIVDDGNMNNIGKFMFNTVAFHVYKNNAIVKTDSFVVSANCCHVFKQNGVDTIVVK